MGIKEDVSSIKTDMANFKEALREKDTIMKEISDVRRLQKGFNRWKLAFQQKSMDSEFKITFVVS